MDYRDERAEREPTVCPPLESQVNEHMLTNHNPNMKYNLAHAAKTAH